MNGMITIQPGGYCSFPPGYSARRGMILDIDPSEDASMWKPYLRASVAQKRDMARIFNALLGEQK